MHELVTILPCSSRSTAPPATKLVEEEEALWLLVDEIAETEGVPHEYAWRLACLRLTALKERSNGS
jgi:hypothetical protein